MAGAFLLPIWTATMAAMMLPSTLPLLAPRLRDDAVAPTACALARCRRCGVGVVSYAVSGSYFES
jgi:predicted metal-binding membrane protein